MQCTRWKPNSSGPRVAMKRMYTKYPVRSPNHDRGFMVFANALRQEAERSSKRDAVCTAVYECQLVVQGYAIVTADDGRGAYTCLLSLVCL